jgi:hypothetical protein
LVSRYLGKLGDSLIDVDDLAILGDDNSLGRRASSCSLITDSRTVSLSIKAAASAARITSKLTPATASAIVELSISNYR